MHINCPQSNIMQPPGISCVSNDMDDGLKLLIIQTVYAAGKGKQKCKGLCYSSVPMPAERYSLFIRAMCETEMPLGHSASHA